MTCSINLVPAARLHARTRTRRRTRWIIAAAALAGANVLIGLSQFAMHRSVHSAVSDLEHVQGQRRDLDRRLHALAQQRDDLLAQLEHVLRARRPQPWPVRLLQLHEVVPEGVFLTGLAFHDGTAAQAARPVRSPRSGSPVVSPARDVAVGGARLELSGFAVDHAAMLEFFHALRELRAWREVELLRANREAFGTGAAVAFELMCRPTEEGS